MKKKRFAINGFGRIGRIATRILLKFYSKNIELIAINDLSDTKTLSHLLKYDSAHKKFNKKITAYKDFILIDKKKKIKVLNEKNPNYLPWKKFKIDVVLECSGFFTTKKNASMHLKAGAKKVIISAPSVSEDIKTIVFNVNHNILSGKEKIISAASCTTNCLAPMAKILNDNCFIESGFMTTIHAYTNDQNTLDAPHIGGDLRRARAAAENIVPNTTGAAKAIGLVIPELKNKLDGSAQRVPVITGSITELVAVIKKNITEKELNNIMLNSTNESFGYTSEPLVSSDIIGSTYGSLFDSTQTKIIKTKKNILVKISSWYDNEYSYTYQLIRLSNFVAKQIK